MSYAIKRRQFVQSMLAGVAASALTAMPRASLWAAASSTLRWTELDTNLALVRGAGGNVFVTRGGDGVMMVDGGRTEHAKALQKLIAEHYGKQRPTLLFNTHWHWDQCGSNALLGKAGATIIAHENTKLWLTTEVISKWEDKTYSPLPSYALPNQTLYYDSHQLTFNNEPIEYGILPQAHTDGDIYVHLPNKNILVVGDLVAGRGYPILDYCTGGWIGGMMDALKFLLSKSDGETRIISGTGDICHRADLEAQLNMLDDVIRKISKNYYASKTYEEFVASKPTAEFDQQWGDPTLFLHLAYESAWWHLSETRRYSRGRR